MKKDQKTQDPSSDYLEELFGYLAEAFQKKSFIEVITIQASLLDYQLRKAIKILIEKKFGSQAKEMEEYWTNGRTQFSQLLERFQLLGGSVEIYKKLKAFNSQRNDIVHAMFKNGSKNALLEKTRKTANFSLDIPDKFYDYLIEVYRDYKSELETKVSSLETKVESIKNQLETSRYKSQQDK